MTNPDPKDTSLIQSDKPGCDPPRSDLPGGVTLESIIDLTEELEHLNELVMLHLENNGGFMGKNAYFAVVQPVLDMLEDEIRMRYQTGMEKTELKQIIQDWIDQEIASLQ
jgi:hypothetical protein